MKRYRLKCYADGYEYHAYTRRAPPNTEDWEDLEILPKDIIEAQKIALEGPTETEKLKARITDLEAAIKELRDGRKT